MIMDGNSDRSHGVVWLEDRDHRLALYRTVLASVTIVIGSNWYAQPMERRRSDDPGTSNGGARDTTNVSYSIEMGKVYQSETNGSHLS